MDENAAIQTQLNRIESKLDAHIERHLNDANTEATWRSAIEQRLTMLETSAKTKWPLVVSILAVVVTVASQVFGLQLAPHLKP